MFIAALFIIAKIWKQLSIHRYTNRQERYSVYTHTYIHTHTHTQEYNAAIKRDESLPFMTTWTDLKSIMLSKIS